MGDPRFNGKWCDQCQAYGHAKWLFLGTHRTHRLYLRYMMNRQLKRAEKRSKKR